MGMSLDSAIGDIQNLWSGVDATKSGSTLLTTGAHAGQLAKDGFNALADLDSNHDGMISSADTQYANLRLWRDLNQDGISQSSELFTLASQNISRINVTSTAHSQTLANGNQLLDVASYTKTDGSTDAVGETLNNTTGNTGDINLAEDTFHRQLSNVLDMQGSGAPFSPDLREPSNEEEWRMVA